MWMKRQIVNSSIRAFTLVELAIVVVVLGILIGGIVAGQSIIESAKKREVITGFTQLRTGLNAFKLEFDAIPGDMEDAYDYWGDDCSTYGNTSVSERKCNGDGDNKVTSETGNFDNYCFSVNCERCMFFKHLNLAGLWNEKFECGDYNLLNEDVYKNPLDYSAFFFVSNRCKSDVLYHNDCDNPSEYISKMYIMSSRNVSSLTTDRWLRSCSSQAASFTPKQQKYLDEKLDDGKPKTGKLVAVPLNYAFNGTLGCHNTTIISGPCLLNNIENAYNVANDDYVCQMHYRLDL
jgi:prepilin-type N-terminal cleavage/methylation domain-containing protein